MTPQDHLDHLLEMKRIANASRARGRRCRYSAEQKERSIEFTGWVLARNGSIEDAAEMMSMHRQTLIGWVERYTDPDTDESEPWSRQGKTVNIHVHL